MSLNDDTDRTDPNQPAKGADLEADLARVGQLVAAAVNHGHDHNDQFVDTAYNRADDLAVWFEGQNLSGAEAVATAWFFLLAAADE